MYNFCHRITNTADSTNIDLFFVGSMALQVTPHICVSLLKFLYMIMQDLIKALYRLICLHSVLDIYAWFPQVTLLMVVLSGEG